MNRSRGLIFEPCPLFLEVSLWTMAEILSRSAFVVEAVL